MGYLANSSFQEGYGACLPYLRGKGPVAAGLDAILMETIVRQEDEILCSAR
jgi:hypothetical protein